MNTHTDIERYSEVALCSIAFLLENGEGLVELQTDGGCTSVRIERCADKIMAHVQDSRGEIIERVSRALVEDLEQKLVALCEKGRSG
jgi:hypothetical protein